MREIVLDTETTGLDPLDGHRLVEIGAVELMNHVATGRTYHQYLNPERDMPAEALAVHGLTAAFLADKPTFRETAGAFLDFVGDAPLIIHNAAFDIRFLDTELERCGRPRLGPARARCTLEMARGRFPGAANTLDALCRRFAVDTSAREKHGALIDCVLLAEVYLELVGGRQPDLTLEVAGVRTGASGDRFWAPPPRPRQLLPRLTAEEIDAHARFVAELGDGALWPA
jgi:DNA polymerase-3 subunit epsilon